MLNSLMESLSLRKSELSDRILKHPWEHTELGPIDTWPENLCLALNICLNSHFPMQVWWGEHLNLLYNDNYIPFLGPKHPHALGQPAKKVWAEIWSVVEPLIHEVLIHKKASWHEDSLMFFDRNLPREEVYITFSLSPIHGKFNQIQGKSSVDGVFCACTETTELIVSNRRLETLRKIAIQATTAPTVQSACSKSSLVLAENLYDIPFSAIYILDKDKKNLMLSTVTGFEEDQSSFMASIDLSNEDGPWPLNQTLLDGIIKEIDLNQFDKPFPGGPWPESASKAVVMPIKSTLSATPVGCLIVGVSPRRLWDKQYLSFFEMLSRHIGIVFDEALAHEVEAERLEALAKLDQAKTIFFNNVSHEFRTPLTLMLNPIQHILDNSHSMQKEELFSSLKMVHRNSVRLLKLVNNFLDFSRIEAKKLKPTFQLTHFSKFILELAEIFRGPIEQAGLSFTVECDLIESSIYVNQNMWEKIIFNLLYNALKFTFLGSIGLKLKKVDSKILVSITDTGTGIDEKELPKLFERFHQIEGAKSRTHAGSGIGLALVRELVQMHQGEISVKSTVGIGTQFTISFPLMADNTALESTTLNDANDFKFLHASTFSDEVEQWLPDIDKAESVGVSEHAINRDVHILIADDNKDMRTFLARILSEKWSVETAANGLEALKLLREKKFDLVLTDIMMPVLDGYDLLKTLRADPVLFALPIIVLSARASTDAKLIGLEAGADDYLIKPFSSIEVIARVESQLKMASRYQLYAENTRLRQEKEAIEKSNHAKDLFLAALSHELRTPLTSILCWSQALKGVCDLDDKVRSGIEAIEDGALAQNQLINDLLDVSSIILGKMVLDLNEVNVLTLIESVIQSFEVDIHKKQLTLQLITQQSAVLLRLDKDRMHQVFHHLLANAIRFTPEKGMIVIFIEEKKDKIIIQVKDNGIGIEPEFLPHIFERFSANTIKNKYDGGLGLGLSLTRDFVELHGGTIEALSEGENKGSVFTLRFSKTIEMHE